MGLKQKLGMGIMSAALGISLIGGGTYAYFSDSEETNNTFAAGTMELTFNQPVGNDNNVIFNIDNMKPGDTKQQAFSLQNTGTLDFSKVMLETDYEVNDAKGDNTENFGKYINVEFFYNTSKGKKIITDTTLNKLKENGPIDVLGDDGLPAGEQGHYENFYVDVSFVDNGEDQNQFQGDGLTLNWTFTADQKTEE